MPSCALESACRPRWGESNPFARITRNTRVRETHTPSRIRSRAWLAMALAPERGAGQVATNGRQQLRIPARARPARRPRPAPRAGRCEPAARRAPSATVPTVDTPARELIVAASPKGGDTLRSTGTLPHPARSPSTARRRLAVGGQWLTGLRLQTEPETGQRPGLPASRRTSTPTSRETASSDSPRSSRTPRPVSGLRFHRWPSAKDRSRRRRATPVAVRCRVVRADAVPTPVSTEPCPLPPVRHRSVSKKTGGASPAVRPSRCATRRPARRRRGPVARRPRPAHPRSAARGGPARAADTVGSGLLRCRSGARSGALRGFLPDTATPRGSLRPTRRSRDTPSAPALPGSGQPVPGAGGTPSDHTAHQPVDRDAGRVLAVGPWRRGRLVGTPPGAQRPTAASGARSPASDARPGVASRRSGASGGRSPARAATALPGAALPRRAAVLSVRRRYRRWTARTC